MSPPEVLSFIDNHTAGRAIDLGCGTGTNVISLAQRQWRVTGIDFSSRAIRIARRRLQAANVKATLCVGDVTHMEQIVGPFDLALDLGCFHGLEDREAYLSSLDRVLAPAGHWLLYGFFRTASAARGPGLDGQALLSIQSHAFDLISRADGVDRRGRASAWMLFQRPPANRHDHP